MQPPLGYRLLAVGEIIAHGDLFLFRGNWTRSIACGMRIGPGETDGYCRRIEGSLSQDELRGVLKDWLSGEMSRISELCYCAGWINGLEFTLWRATLTPLVDCEYELAIVPALCIQKLRKVAEYVGGWFVWQDGETFKPMQEWLQIYDQHARESEAAHQARESDPAYIQAKCRLQQWWTSNMKLDRSNPDAI